MWNRLEQRELKRVSRRISDYSAGQLPAPGQPAGTDLLPQIKHIVVLMMENHSYDNYLGMLPGRGEGFPLGPDGQPEVSNTGAQGETVPAHHWPSTDQMPETPSQSWHATHLQWADGKLDGFVSATQQLMPDKDPTQAMGYWTERDLPFYYGLARTFPLADRWFSSCLGPTFPNRRFLISGTANGLIDDLPMNMADYPEHGTIFDQLSKYGISWVNYHPLAGGKTGFRSALRHRRRMLQRRLRSLRALNPTSLAQLGKDMQFTADIYPLGIGRYMRHVRGTGAVLHRRRQRHAARGQPRGPRLQGVLRGEPAGHPEGRELRLGGGQAGHARQGVGQHPADLALRRARRLLRPRPAAARRGAGRRAGPQRVQPPDLDPRGHGLAVPGLREERPEAGRGAEALRPLRLPGPGGDGLAVRPARAT